jgi:PIN domain nuclease of toxin-antitoxin system
LRLLLDTHVFLWWITLDARLSAKARKLISAVENDSYFSAASAWEIAIKLRMGRLEVAGELQAFLHEQLAANRFQVLPVQVRHAARVATLPDHHRDPFDRLLIAQAELEELTLVSADPLLRRYGVDVAW